MFNLPVQNLSGLEDSLCQNYSPSALTCLRCSPEKLMILLLVLLLVMLGSLFGCFDALQLVPKIRFDDPY